MNNDTSNRSTPATASPLTVKEAAPPVMIKKIGKTTYRVKSISVKRAKKP